jgi:hypothetical protein
MGVVLVFEIDFEVTVLGNTDHICRTINLPSHIFTYLNKLARVEIRFFLVGPGSPKSSMVVICLEISKFVGAFEIAVVFLYD